MRLILFLALICFCFEYIYSKQDQQQQQHELNLEDRKLRNQIFSKTELNERYKEKYLANRGMMIPDYEEIATVKALRKSYLEMSEDFGDVLSLQVVNDWKECVQCSRGIGYMFYILMMELRGWNATNFVRNVAHVEQKQQEVLNKYGALYYEFLHEDFMESLELFEMDLKRCNGLSSDSVSRVMSLMRIFYGNRTEIETGLSCLYGSPSVVSVQ